MGKKGKKKQLKVSLEQFDSTPLAKEALVSLAIALQQETQRERIARESFLAEGEKLRAMWEVTRCQLHDARATLRDEDHHQDDEDIERLMVIKFHEQQNLFTMLDNQRKLADIKIDNMEVLHKAQEDNLSESLELRKQRLTVEKGNKEMDRKQHQAMQDAIMAHSRGVTRESEGHALRVAALSEHWERLGAQLRSASDAQSVREALQVQERHKAQAETLLAHHSRDLIATKDYYNEITSNNLSQVATLKEECGELREREERAVQLVRSLRAENRGLAEPLAAVRKELQLLHRQMAHFDKDKAALRSAIARADAQRQALTDAGMQREALLILTDKVRGECEALAAQVAQAQAELRLAQAAARARAQRQRSLSRSLM